LETAFFVLSKILAPLLAPENWIFLLGITALLLLAFRRLRAAAALLALALALYAAIAVFPWGTVLLNALERAYPAGPAVTDPTGIIVLGGGEDARRSIRVGQPMSNDAGDRLLAGLILAQTFPEASVIYTSGIARLDQAGTPGADVAATLLVGAGLPAERLILERRSRNTAENAEFSLPLRPDVDGPWILVTSAFHMRRSVASFCAAGWRDLVPWPTDYRGGDFVDGIGWSFSEHARDLEIAIREVVGLAVYRATGRAVSPAPPGCLVGP
jgi:uncharacterized SAM-binding protein YcdF (DUF218 family)